MITEISPFEYSKIKNIVKIYNSYLEFFDFPIDENFVSFSLNKNFKIFAYTIEKEVIGFCGLYFYNPEICEIGPIGVDKNFLKMKIGKELLNYVLNIIKNFKKCFVKVKKNNLRAINFFLKFGFKIKDNLDDIKDLNVNNSNNINSNDINSNNIIIMEKTIIKEH